MTADVFKKIIDAELSRINRLTAVSNIVLTVEFPNKEYHIKLTQNNSWWKAPEILQVKDSEGTNVPSGIVKISGAENSVSSTTIPTSGGFTTRTTWNRTIFYIDPEEVQSMYFTFDNSQDSQVVEPEESGE